MKKLRTIKELDLENKRVIIRVDFNVPIKDGKITDDNRIRESLDTIKYVIKHNGKAILMSHLGRIKEEADLKKNTLLPVRDRLAELLGKEVYFSEDTRGSKLEEKVRNLKNGDVLLIENTRYEDLKGEKESKNDPDLGEYWASLGDCFVNDAFGTSHRAHASNCGIMHNMKDKAIGFLVEKEFNNIMPAIESPERPFTVILGGAKVSDKIGVIDNLLDKADYILVGGGMAYTFLKAKCENIGNSLLDSESLEYCTNLLKKTDKIILPIDHVVGDSIEGKGKVSETIDDDMMGLDIGPKTIEEFKAVIAKSKTIIWNGPVGCFENPEFSHGTEELCKEITKTKRISIVGGGDTASAVINLGFKDKFTHVSTGGGASLELLEGKEFPFIKEM